MMIDKSISTEIKDAEKTVALTEQKCAATRQRILEMMEQEKTEKDGVNDIVHTSVFKCFKKKKKLVKSMHVFLFITDFAIKI